MKSPVTMRFPTDREWSVYKKGVAPAPKVVLHHSDPRRLASAHVIFVLGGRAPEDVCELAETQLGWTHLSTGELLRAQQRRCSCGRDR